MVPVTELAGSECNGEPLICLNYARGASKVPRSGVDHNNKTHPQGVDELNLNVVAQGNVTTARMVTVTI